MGWTPADLWHASFSDYASSLESFNAHAAGRRPLTDDDVDRGLEAIARERRADRRRARQGEAA